jgi:hypothetical protein
LALDNVRRIAETLREERNNLTVLLQEQRGILDEALDLLKIAKAAGSPEFRDRIDRLSERADAL